VRHLFITQDYAPDLGGMARRHVELCRRFGDATVTMDVSTVKADGAEQFDAGEPNRIYRQPFYFSQAKLFANQLRWTSWLLSSAQSDVRVIHCGNVRPVGYAVILAHLRRRTPFLLYVNGSDLLPPRSRYRCAPCEVGRRNRSPARDGRSTRAPQGAGYHASGDGGSD